MDDLDGNVLNPSFVRMGLKLNLDILKCLLVYLTW